MVLTRAGGDSPFLLVRVQQLTTNLRAGVLPARWMPDGAHGLGYPFYDFYASLPYYAAAILHWAGADLVLSIQITQLAGFVVASIATYGLACSLSASPAAALAASALYTFAPYHLANVYVRGDALSEFTAMALYPLILWCIQKLRSRDSWPSIAALSTSFAALILTHNVSALLFAPLTLVWLGFRALTASPSERHGLLWSGLAGLALGLLLSLWFWAPALRERTLVQLEEQTTGYLHYAGHFVQNGLAQLRLAHDYALSTEAHPFRMGSVQAGIALLGLIAVAARLVRGQRLQVWQMPTALAALAYTVMMLPISRPLWDHLPLIAMAQFPWRLLSVQALLVALLGTSLVPVRRTTMGWVAAASIIALAAWNGLGALSMDRVLITPEDVTPQRVMLYETFSGNIGTTIRHEYLPRWMIPRPRTSAVQLAEGSKPVPLALEGEIAEARPVEITPSSEAWSIQVSEPSLLAFHTTYYPGWEANVDGTPQGVEPLEGLGLLGLRLQPGSHDVELRLTRTPVRRYALAASLLAAVSWLALLVQALRASRRARKAALTGIAVGVLTSVVAWGIARVPTGRGPATCPIVADFARCPLFHREPEGLWWEDAHLLAYSIEPDPSYAGGSIDISLIWNEPVALTVRARLMGLSGHLLPPTPVWAEARAPLDAAITRLTLTLPEHLAPGHYAVYIDVLDAGIALQPTTATGHPMGNVSLLPVRVKAGRGTAPDHEPLGTFGPPETPPILALTSVSTSNEGEDMLQVALTWEALAQAPRNYWLSLRLQNTDGKTLTSRDIPPFLGGYPTTLWRPGQVLSDRVLLPMPEDADASGTRLEIVLYDRATLSGIGSVIVPVQQP